MMDLFREQALYDTTLPFSPPFPSELSEAEMRDKRNREAKKPFERWVSRIKRPIEAGGALDVNKGKSREEGKVGRHASCKKSGNFLVGL